LAHFDVGVIQITALSDEYTPLCSSCGIQASFDISKQDYEGDKKYWDNWQCGLCSNDSVIAHKILIAKRQGKPL